MGKQSDELLSDCKIKQPGFLVNILKKFTWRSLSENRLESDGKAVGRGEWSDYKPGKATILIIVLISKRPSEDYPERLMTCIVLLLDRELSGVIFIQTRKFAQSYWVVATY